MRGLNDSVVDAYYSYMVDMAVIFGADRDKAREDMLEVLSFEMSLANVGSLCNTMCLLHQANKRRKKRKLNRKIIYFRSHYRWNNVETRVNFIIH